MKKLLMIGDSITDWFNSERYLAEYHVRNMGNAGDSTVECWERINKSWFKDEEIISLLIGTNDLMRDRSDDEIVNNIREIVKKIRRYSYAELLILTSILPRNDGKEGINNRIIKINDQLKDISKSHNSNYFDLHSHFVNENKLKNEYSIDGLHLSRKGYEVWADRLKKFLMSV